MFVVMDEVSKSRGYVRLPVEVIVGPDGYVLSTDTSVNEHGHVCVSFGKTRKRAEEDYLSHLNVMWRYYKDRSRELDLWKPFQSGDWSSIGGKWIIVYGIHVYFRVGSGMRGGWYVPFTRLNIMVVNLWRRRGKA